MKSWRTQPRATEQINASLEAVKATARDDLKVIHLIPCDYKKVALKPARFDCGMSRDGTLHTVFKGRMILVAAVE